ncbi:uncharacterized protein si:dkey-106l3.7 [Xyrauchen texanus]|uniref:uncharacterized protein si:dkey-106l3.7 n=1 Tax=Xyrauchen texanus TaxID=154827 RepID=UPI002242A9B7|nr:uncharacterized protein si:dkey-106l3.7 [Xyrauchen texanus]
MNLYRNFGNLLESWVTEGYTDLHSQTEANVERLDSIGSGSEVQLSKVKSESEDSGFETVSTISPCHSHQCSGFTSESHSASLVNVSAQDDVRPSSPSPSVCTSSSSCVSLGSVAPRKTCLKVEQALRRTETTSGHVSRRGAPHKLERGATGPRHRCNTATFPTSCHTTNARTHYWFSHPRRTHSQPSDHKKAELCRRLLKSHQYGQTVESQLEFEEGEQCRRNKLSPGLLYLEQVCRMLENIAKLQQQNHTLQKEVEMLKSQHAEIKCASLNEEEINYPASQSLEIDGPEDQTSLKTRLKDSKEFRHRSQSDTRAFLGPHRRARFAQDESFVSAGVLFEEPDSKYPIPENEHKKPSKIQKLKFTSFRRQKTRKPDTENKSVQPEKKTKLSIFFRSRRMTTRL